MVLRFLIAASLALSHCVFAIETDNIKASDQPSKELLSIRDRVPVINEILESRLEKLLPKLMKKQDIDMWLVISREYNEDPLFKTLVPEPVFAARRTTILAFSRSLGSVERVTLSRYGMNLYQPAWNPEENGDQWQQLATYIESKKPKRIAVNNSDVWAIADGLSHSLRRKLEESLPETYRKRLVSAEKLAVSWAETRIDEEKPIYEQAVSTAKSIIATAFSNKVVTPGQTTLEDVVWYIRDQIEQRKLRPWFQPTVDLQRKDVSGRVTDLSEVIRRGDVLHTDVGLCYLRLCTDTQEMAIVLEPKRSIPAGFVTALELGNRWQDQLTDSFQTGRSGNDVLKNTQRKSEELNLDSKTYTHPIGFFGHGPGPAIGMWDNQNHVPHTGDWQIAPQTAYAIEGSVQAKIKEWDNQEVAIMLEQNAIFDGKKVDYIAGRQTKWHVIQ